MAARLKLAGPRRLPAFKITAGSANGLHWTLFFEGTSQTLLTSDETLRDQRRFRRALMQQTYPVVFIPVISDARWAEAVTAAIQEFETEKKQAKEKTNVA
ncbi:hypothetical protein AUC71_07750 [Methyloceanibacter marginalis]|uniref:Uncharacterized protein n=1 Tax=Methyloceanibacter marginalis TaxID=1774971 RepID=A0A1E3WDI1_9HYPH|nr:hypothetical protein [Methyloceanibacter marginalis]ODS03790.1 hypothetical protein AUC71_07750 [Methyloceanibacter marginalis]